jgi:hypothetical protein
LIDAGMTNDWTIGIMPIVQLFVLVARRVVADTRRGRPAGERLHSGRRSRQMIKN